MTLAIRDIEMAVAAEFGLTRAQILGMSRARAMARPRQIAMALAREITGQSLPRIGQHFARDHTTVMYAVRHIARLAAKDAALADRMAACRARLAASEPWKDAARAEIAMTDNWPPSVRHTGKPATAHLPSSAASPHGGRKPVTGS
jgi:Bacterial dnaA protein helix-turn-helix